MWHGRVSTRDRLVLCLLLGDVLSLVLLCGGYDPVFVRQRKISKGRAEDSEESREPVHKWDTGNKLSLLS